jgi:hypothetical protein
MSTFNLEYCWSLGGSGSPKISLRKARNPFVKSIKSHTERMIFCGATSISVAV